LTIRLEAKSKQNAVEIPEAYLCVITQEIMIKPVICTLDGRTYEDSSIREWLGKHGTSPVNRTRMKPNQTLDDILIDNRNLEDAIEIFRKENPQLFIKNALNM